jgi:Domain of unknown function (DUF4432)
MTDLCNGALRARLRADHGFDITSITVDGHEILSVMPWQPGTVVPEAGEDAWTRAWTGGWQLAAPSSGNACVAEGIQQGFHGTASQAAWTITGSTVDSALAVWGDDGGLRLERTVVLDVHTVQVTTTARNMGRSVRHLIATEHLTFGSALLADGVTLEASGHVADIDAGGRVASPPKPWPGERWDHVPASGPAARFSALYGCDGHVRLASPGGLAVTVRWDPDVLPYAWLWQEIESMADQPWAGRGRALGIEPSMTPHSAGLAAAIDDGTARRLPPGNAMSWHVDVAVEPGRYLRQEP